MKKLFQILLLSFSIPLQAQIVFDFELGNLDGWHQSRNNHWETSSNNPINGSYSLHHSFNDSIANHDQISMQFSKSIDFTDTVAWSFRIKHSYNPSATNNWTVFLASDKPSENMVPGATVNGLAVGVNFTGSDDILRLLKIDNGIASVIIETPINWEKTIGTTLAPLIIVKRLPDSSYVMLLSRNGSVDSISQIGAAKDNYVPNPIYFGIYYKYSVTCDRKLWLDDIKIDAKFVSDTIPPKIDTAFIVSGKMVEINFSEPVSANTIIKDNFKLENSSNAIDSVLLSGTSKVLLFMNQPLKNDSTILIDIAGITDLKGNTISPTKIFLTYLVVHPYDVVISEIMANPEPVVSLPPYEYVEFYNRTNKPINLKGWKFSVRDLYMSLPEFVIPAKEYGIICTSNAYSSFKKDIPIICSWNWNSNTLLTNTGTTLTLQDSVGLVISFVNYSDEWYGNSFKKDGGWALEMIDSDNPCGGKENWAPSNDKSGGTPGRQNSVAGKNADNTSPEFLYTFVPRNDSIILKFSEPLGFSSTVKATDFFVDNGIGNPLTIGFLRNDFTQLVLKFSSSLDTNKNYVLHIDKTLCDCVGNSVADNLDIPIAVPKPPDSLDVVINEVLYNPYSYGSRFVELYNRSVKTIDAGMLVLSYSDSAGNNTSDFKISNPGLLLNSGSYLAITKSIDGLQNFYQLQNKAGVIENSNFPAFSDKCGIVTLATTTSKIIDKFRYSDQMQFALLGNAEGVSLERLSANVPTQVSTNWHSAAQSAGYATPGYQNSQIANPSITSDEVNITPEVFTPDNDGHDDYVSIQLNNVTDYNLANIRIYNASGQCVSNLVSNAYLATSNIFTWNGVSDGNRLQQSGIYLIYIQLVSDKGKTKEIKKVCVLANKK